MAHAAASGDVLPSGGLRALPGAELFNRLGTPLKAASPALRSIEIDMSPPVV
jgi:hypothetical protein